VIEPREFPAAWPRRGPLVAGIVFVALAAVVSPPFVERVTGALHWTDAAVRWTLSIALALVAVVLGCWAWTSKGITPAVLMRRSPRAAAFGVGIVSTLLCLGLVEGGFFLAGRDAEGPPAVERGTSTEGFYESDVLLGYRPVAGSRVTAIKLIGDRVVYDVVYTIDDEGRRVTPASSARAGDSLVLFFGGSVTFGEGVQDDETLPNAFAAAAPGTRVLNYGFRGYGPQQMLAMLEDGRLDHEIENRDVTAVYTFIDAHVARAVGSMIIVTSWGVDMPHYVSGPDGRLLLDGSFRTGRPIVNWLYALASKSHVVSYLGADLPPRRAKHFDLTARIVRQSADRIAARAASTRMFVVLHPSVRAGEPIAAALAGSPVQVLDFTGLWDASDPAYVIPDDWHPTPLGHRLLAQELVPALARSPRDSP